MKSVIQQIQQAPPPVCRGVYAKFYALRFMSKNPRLWIRWGYLDKKF
ncbi:hypothetical protein [Candidatus Protochlamydia amoebophila]|nr:hypothetical protein [Candidatus Protochlamydia amoebophila]